MLWSDIRQWIDVIGSFAMVPLTVIIYRWTLKTERASALREINTEWQNFNAAIISDPELLRLDIEGHPFEKLPPDEHRKMYLHFMRLNVAYTA